MMDSVPDHDAEHRGGAASAVRGFGVLAGANIIGQALGFAALAIVARRIGASALGNYNFALSLAMYFGLLANPGVGYIATRDVSLQPGRVSSVVSESISLQAFASVIAYVLIVTLAPWLTPNGQARSLVPIVGLSLIAGALSLDSVLLALRSRVPVAVARVAGQVVYAALVPILVTRTSGPSPYAWLNLLGIAVTAAIISGVLWHKRAWRFITPRPSALWTRLRRSTGIGYSVTMIQLYNRADMLLLGYLATSRDVGVYAVANRLPYSVVTFANLWIQANFPLAVVTMREDPARFRADVSRVLTAATVVAIAIACGAVVFPSRLMAALFGHAFSAAGRPFAILTAAMALVLIEAILSNILIAGSRDKRYAQIVTLAACVNIGLNLVLIPSLAASGSALATLVTEALLVVMTLVATRSIVGLPRLDVARLGRGAACVALMCGAMVALGTVSVWLALFAGAAVFAASAAVFRVFDPALWRRHQ